MSLCAVVSHHGGGFRGRLDGRNAFCLPCAVKVCTHTRMPGPMFQWTQRYDYWPPHTHAPTYTHVHTLHACTFLHTCTHPSLIRAPAPFSCYAHAHTHTHHYSASAHFLLRSHPAAHSWRHTRETLRRRVRRCCSPTSTTCLITLSMRRSSCTRRSSATIFCCLRTGYVCTRLQPTPPSHHSTACSFARIMPLHAYVKCMRIYSAAKGQGMSHQMH